MMRPAFLFILLAIALSCRAQKIIPRFDNIGVNDGLSQSSVYSIFQDRKGFMWFGTADGLNCYDGQSLRVYKIADRQIANSNFIHGNICQDSRGDIWFCNETGLFFYDRQSDSLSRKVVFKKYRWTEGIFIDKNDIFYICSPDEGIYGYNIKTGTLAITACRFQTPYSDFIAQGLTTNNINTIWLNAPSGGGLLALNTQTGVLRHISAAPKFYSLFYTGQGRLYFLDVSGKITVTDTSMHVLGAMDYKFSKGRFPDVQAICRDRYGRTWLGTYDRGLFCYDQNATDFTNYLHNNSQPKSLPINVLSVLCIDRSDNLWIGTDGGGVCKLDLKPQKFNLFPLNEGDYPFLKDYFIKCFYEDGKARIWFGTNSSGLNIFDPQTGRVTRCSFGQLRPGGLPGSIVSCLLKAKDSSLWIATSLGIFVLDKDETSLSAVAIKNEALVNDHSTFVYKLTALRNGRIAAGTSLGLMIIRKTGRRYTGTVQYPGLLTTDVVETADGSLWATSPLEGLFHYKKAGEGYRAVGKSMPMIDLRSIHQDGQDGRMLWVCSGIGLIRFNTLNGAQTVYDEKNGMANSYVYGVLEDAQHDFWMSTNMGLCFFNRRTNTFQNYTANDGLQSNEFNTQAFYKGPSGNLYFGGIKGFNWFNPQRQGAAPATMPGVAVTAVDVGDGPYRGHNLFNKTQTVRLPYNQNNISFRFAALDFTKPKANKIKYMLEGWDKKWITSADMDTRYAHLLPGNYTLRVMAANSDGVWSAEERLTVIIEAPFWKKRWFYFCAGVAVIGLIVYVTFVISRQKIKKQLHDLEKRYAVDAERNRISRDMHDEIGSGLTHIALLTDLMQSQQKTGKAVNADLDSISSVARKLVENISEIVWALNPQNDSLENLLSYLREKMQQLFEPFGLLFQIDFPDEVPGLKLSDQQRRNLYLVTKEALNNVMKHAGAHNVALKVAIAPGYLTFEVIDDGHGLPEIMGTAVGNGLKNMRKRMEDMGGTIEWIKQNKGLKVVYALNY